MITHKTDILNMWADHFETLNVITYDKSFLRKFLVELKICFQFFQGISKEY